MSDWITSLFDPQHLNAWGVMGALVLLMLIAFLSATLLPLGSEPALVGFLLWQPRWWLTALLLATVANSAGGLFNWWLGKSAKALWRERTSPPQSPTPKNWVSNWCQKILTALGPKGLLLSWLPLVGDPLCVLAGWLEWQWLLCLCFMSLGKGLRYGFLSWVTLQSML
jgi:membrane protein YqaA with SNARE-associated domain